MNRKFRIAFVGAGYMTKEHIQAFNDIEEFELVGICSRTKSKAEALQSEFSITATYDTIGEMYDTTLADFVVIAVSELSANAISRECFQYPWKVLLEKPAGYNYSDACEIVQVAKDANRDVFVALNRRFYSSVSTALESLQGVNSTRFVKIQDQEDQKEALDYGVPELVVENLMYANAIHMIDLIRVFARGNIKSIENIVPWDPQNPGIVLSIIEFDSGDKAFYEGVWEGPAPWAVTVNTPEIRWELRPIEEVGFQNKGERHMNKVQIGEWDKKFKPGLRKMAEHCLLALQKKDNQLVSIQDALISMNIVKQIFNAD